MGRNGAIGLFAWLRAGFHRAGTPRCEFRGAHLPRHRTGGIADRTANPLQIRHQLEDGQSNRTDDPAICLGPRRRGDRINLLFTAVHESASGTFRTWPRWPTMSAVGGTAEVVARLVAIIEGWLDSLVASPKILRTQMMNVNEGPLLARSGHL